MLSFLPEVVRRRSGITAPVLGLLARPTRAARRHPRTTAVVLALLLLCAAGAGLYGYALHRWNAAQAAVKANRLDEAQRHLDFCLFLWPRSIPVRLLAARAARLRGDLEGAEAHLNRCLKLNHGASEEIQLEFLLLRVQGGEEDEVMADLFSLYVDQNSPESPLILETLARAYMQNLRYGPAFACLSRWAEVAPDSAEPHRWRGWILERLNDMDEAIKEYKRALELDPEHVSARLRLAELYLGRADPLGALPHLERLYRQFPDRPDIQARLGQCRVLQGNAQEARPLLEAAVQQLPNDSMVLIHLAKIEQEDNHLAKAEEWLRRALQVDPTDAEAEFRLANVLQAQGRSEEARAMLARYEKDRALLTRIAQTLRQDAENPNLNPAVLTEIGILFLPTNERLGRYWLHRALKNDPGYQPAHQALAEHYEAKGELEKASAHRRQLKSVQKPAASPGAKSEGKPKPEIGSPKPKSRGVTVQPAVDK